MLNEPLTGMDQICSALLGLAIVSMGLLVAAGAVQGHQPASQYNHNKVAPVP